MASIHVGLSGWQYDNWTGDFYPRELPKRRHLEYVTRLFGAVEVNGTFYSLESPSAFERWYATSAPRSIFALKGSRYITHMLRLRDVETALANFFANGLLRLEDKLGPILWQLPPHMEWDRERFESFCASLPRDMNEASRLGRAHDARVSGKVSLAVHRNRKLRHAFEIRDPRMLHEESLKILKKHRFALVVPDTAGKHPFCEDITAGFMYVRLHGDKELYASGYDEQTLRWWARRIRRWAEGGQMKTATRVSQVEPPRRKQRDVYVFFDNDVKVHAPFDALTLLRLLGRHVDPTACQDTRGNLLPCPPRIANDQQVWH